MKVGDTFRYQCRKHHVVKIFEDNGDTIYVTRFYGEYTDMWHYEAFTEHIIESYIERGFIR